MDTSDFGIKLLKLTGIIIASNENRCLQFISSFYKFHITFAFVYLICVHLITLNVHFNDTFTMFNILWRMIGLSTLFAQTQLLKLNSLKLQKLLSDSSNLHIISLSKQKSLKKLFNVKFTCYIAVIALFMILHSIRKFAMPEMITYNTSDIIEFFIPDMFPYPFSTLLHIHVSFIIAQNFFVLIGHDFLFIYLISVTQIMYLSNCKESIENLKFKDSASEPIANSSGGLYEPDDSITVHGSTEQRGGIKHCVMLHQHIIDMVHSINSVFSPTMLLLLWRIFVMSVAACELTKGINQLQNGIEVFMILTISMVQLFTLCWAANVLKDQSVSMVDVCLHKAWHGVVTTRGSHVSGERRCLLVMAERFNWPMQFRAGPFYRLSTATFTSVLGLCFSYYTFFFGLKYREDNGKN